MNPSPTETDIKPLRRKPRLSEQGREILRQNALKARMAKAAKAAKGDKGTRKEKEDAELVFPAVVHLLIWNTYARAKGYQAFAPNSITGRDDPRGDFWEVRLQNDAILVTQYVQKRKVDAAISCVHAADSRIPAIMAREAALKDALQNTSDPEERDRIASQHQDTLKLLAEVVASRENARKTVQNAVKKRYQIPLAALEEMALYGIMPDAYELADQPTTLPPLGNIPPLGLFTEQKETTPTPKGRAFIEAHKDEWPFNTYALSENGSENEDSP